MCAIRHSKRLEKNLIHEYSNLRVIHFSTSDIGGAALAAMRLHESLLVLGIDSSFVTLDRSKKPSGSHVITIRRTWFRKISGSLITFIQIKLSRRTFFSSVSIRSVRWSDIRKLVDAPNTVVHLHNTYNFLSFLTIARILRKGIPVVQTAHDQRILTGGCHYAYSCTKIHSGCYSCPAIPRSVRLIPSVTLRIEQYFYRNANHFFSIIAPSKWLYAEIGKSKLTEFADVYFLPNIPPRTELEPTSTRSRTHNRIVIGLAAMDPRSYIKGGDIVEWLQNAFNKEKSISFLELSALLREGGTLEDFWGSIDVLLVPSRADNSPNVIHEAKQKNVPVIASAIGGITELLQPGIDIGVEYEKTGNTGFKEAIELFLATKKSKEELLSIRPYWQSYTENSLSQHIALYRKILARG